MTVYRRVAGTINALAQAGRVVIVGRGGVCITRKLRGGVHVRLVAPLPQRISFMMRRFNLSAEAAAQQVRTRDRNREQFYRRYWPDHPLVAEMFTVTLNTEGLSEQQVVESLLPLIVPGYRQSERVGARTA
jgi:cytidylate kinase